MIIRKADLNDTPVLACLSVKLWPEHTLDEMIEEFRSFLSDDDTALFLAEEETAVGFAQCQLRYDYVEGTQSSPVGYLEGILVEETFRSRGCARKLLAACEAWARGKGCSEFASDCELDNRASLSFHLNLGFEEANRIICFTKKL